MTARRGNGMAMAALSGLGAAILFLSIPGGLVEMLVASSGLSEIFPAAAPPLGLKARLLLAAFAGLMAIGIVGTISRDQSVGSRERVKRGRDKGAQGARKMGFAFSRLTALARGRQADPIDRGAPVLRRADAHPDAPARAPIFASRDFDGLDIFARTEPGRRQLVVNREPAEEPVVPAAGLAMPSAPPPLDDADLPVPTAQPAFLRTSTPAIVAPEPHITAEAAGEVLDDDADEGAWEPAVAFTPQPQPQPAPNPNLSPLPLPSTHNLSVAELTARLERGLAMRARSSAAQARVIADMPVAPAVAVRDTVAQDMDDALRAALGTLRSMAGRPH